MMTFIIEFINLEHKFALILMNHLTQAVTLWICPTQPCVNKHSCIGMNNPNVIFLGELLFITFRRVFHCLSSMGRKNGDSEK